MKRLLFVLLILAPLLNAQMNLSAQGNSCAIPQTAGCTYGLPTDTYNQLLADMQANPAPVITPIKVDEEEVKPFSFFIVTVGAQIFDAPNGNVIGTVGDGLNYVSVYGRQDGFAKMRDGSWLKLTDLKRTGASLFAGVELTEPLKYPMVWVLKTSIVAEYPGGPYLNGQAIVKRYDRYNVYATVRAGQFDWYLIGPGMWIEQRRVSKVDPKRKPANAPTTGKWVSVDLFEQIMVTYEGTTPVAATMISSGLPPLNTNLGTFKVYQRLELTALRGSMGEADGYSLPNVPYAMFFDKDIGFHGVYWHDGFGYMRSHGCVNLSISDAKWLFEWSNDTPELTVIVWSSRV
jgi:hypothetical protein